MEQEYRLQDAKDFLKALAPTTKNFLFFTYDDSAEKNPDLVRSFYGTFDNYKDKLVELNRRGASVCVTINETKGRSRSKEDVHMCRAIWQEDDKGTIKVPEIDPSITIETSPGKWHRYWIIKGGTEDLRMWSMLQQSLVDNWDSDPNVKDINRVMRLPGFQHKKNPSKPFLTRIVTPTPSVRNRIKSYTIEDLKDYFLSGVDVEKEREKAYKEVTFDAIEAIQDILEATNFHGAQVSLALHYANLLPHDEVLPLLKGLFYMSKEAGSERWRQRMKDLPRAVASAIKKVNEERENSGAFVYDPELEKEREEKAYIRYIPPPGFLNVIADNVASFMRYPSYEIAVETALHIASTFSGNVYDFEGVPNHRKMVLLAPQGRGKNVVKTYTEKVCIALSMKNKVSPLYFSFQGAGDYTSPKQIHLELQEFGSRSMISSEAGHSQATTAGDRAALRGYENQVLASPPSSVILPRKQAQHSNETSLRPLFNVCLNIVHESVPSNYAKLLSDREAFTDGGVSRTSFIFIDGTVDSKSKNPHSYRAAITDEIVEKLNIIADRNIDEGDPTHKLNTIPCCQAVEADIEALDLFEKLEEKYTDINNTSEDPITESIHVRKILKIKQTAKLLAILDDPIQPRITLDHAKWAVHRSDVIDDALLYHTKRGELAIPDNIFATKAVQWCGKYYRGDLLVKPTTVEKTRRWISGAVFARNFYASIQHIMAKLDQVPAYKHKTINQRKASILQDLIEAGLFLELETPIKGGKYHQSRKTKDLWYLGPLDK